eukprot:CAMPEP_0184754338 /NCGR_PEP_ID=MMETSP0315-20130426/44571_1 /TAXON_ID=101924 /ORGANISM="Rhodosorus marinus, Strain UTEX LB 2760" /LENGTH=345 /DNA_ID=CAMNT_0027233755 /DNA_START=216 /DNA_END=1254 /DNA_ORIENTATION=-
MSREDASVDVAGSNPLLSPARATIATPKWRKRGLENTIESAKGPDAFRLDAEKDVRESPGIEEEEEEEDTCDEAFLQRHEEFASEERKRWLPLDKDKKMKSPSLKKRQKLTLRLPIFPTAFDFGQGQKDEEPVLEEETKIDSPPPIFPTAFECHRMVIRALENDGLLEERMPSKFDGGCRNGYGTRSADSSQLRKQWSAQSANGAAHQKNGKHKDERMLISTESFKRLSEVLSREKDYFNRVINGLERCMGENEPSIVIHTDAERKLVFVERDFDQLMRNVKYSYDTVASLQLLLREKSEGLKRENKKVQKMGKGKALKNGKTKDSQQTGSSKLIPDNYRLEGSR